MSEYLMLTCADQRAQTFTEVKELRVEGDPRAVLASLPAVPKDCGHDDFCYLIDLQDEDGDLLDTKEVEPRIAHALAGWPAH